MKFHFSSVLLVLKFILPIKCETEHEVCYNERGSYDWSPYYQILLAAVNNSSAKDECITQIKSIAKGLNEGEVWALKAFDASESLRSGFIYGQNFWYGSQLPCDILNGGYYIFMSNQYSNIMLTASAPFAMKYFTIYASYHTPNQFKPVTLYDIPLQIGVCLPNSCNSHTIFNLSKEVFSKNTMRFQEVYNITMDILEVRDSSLTKFLQNHDTIVILSGLFTVILFVILMNIIRQQKKNENSFWYRLANCFDLKKNFDDLMDTSTPVGTVATISGIKSLVCLIIMFLHLPYYSNFAANNVTEMYFRNSDILPMTVFMALIYVDAFFVISAFLLTYNFLKNEKQQKMIEENNIWQNVKLFLNIVLHRYIRLTPALMLTMALSQLIAIYMKEATQFYVHEHMDLYCTRNSWWRGLLYIQNFYTLEKMCGTWLWYLSAEMIYFLITLMGLFIFVKKKTIMKWVFVCLSAFSIFYSFYKNYQENFTFGFDSVWRTANSIYIGPFVRMNPFLPGILGGYLLYQYKYKTSTPLKISKLMIYSWILVEACFLAGATMIIKYFPFLPEIVTQLLNSTGRYCFGCLVVWTILINNFDDNGFSRWFLSHKSFVHFSKLSYLMYLLYPLIVYFYRALCDISVTFSISNILTETMGTIFICYLASLILTLFFEIPYNRISNEFLRIRWNVEDNLRKKSVLHDENS